MLSEWETGLVPKSASNTTPQGPSTERAHALAGNDSTEETHVNGAPGLIHQPLA